MNSNAPAPKLVAVVVILLVVLFVSVLILGASGVSAGWYQGLDLAGSPWFDRARIRLTDPLTPADFRAVTPDGCFQTDPPRFVLQDGGGCRITLAGSADGSRRFYLTLAQGDLLETRLDQEDFLVVEQTVTPVQDAVDDATPFDVFKDDAARDVLLDLWGCQAGEEEEEEPAAGQEEEEGDEAPPPRNCVVLFNPEAPDQGE